MDAQFPPRTVARIQTRALGDLLVPRAHMVPLYHGGSFTTLYPLYKIQVQMVFYCYPVLPYLWNEAVYHLSAVVIVHVCQSYMIQISWQRELLTGVSYVLLQCITSFQGVVLFQNTVPC